MVADRTGRQDSPIGGGGTVPGSTRVGVSIASKNGPVFGACGRFSWLVELGEKRRPVEKSGTTFILQHVKIRWVTWTCPGGLTANEMLDYWEAFELRDGRAVEHDAIKSFQAKSGAGDYGGKAWDNPTVPSSAAPRTQASGFDAFNSYPLRAGAGDDCGRLMYSADLFQTSILPPSMGRQPKGVHVPTLVKTLGTEFTPWGGLPASDRAPAGFLSAAPDAIRLVQIAWACCPKVKFQYAQAWWSTIGPNPVGEHWSDKSKDGAPSTSSERDMDPTVVQQIMEAHGWR